MKRVFIVILVVIMLTSNLTFITHAQDRTSPFVDVKETDWYYSSVERVYNLKIMKGVGNGIFAPHDKLTREQAAVILYQWEGNNEIYTSYSFDDVKAGSWYANAVEWLYQNNFTSGISENLYGVGLYITKQDFISLIYRVYQTTWEEVKENGEPIYLVSGGLEKFRDRDMIADYAKKPMLFACRISYISTNYSFVEIPQPIIVGHNNLLNPQKHCTRAEAATILCNVDFITYVMGFGRKP